VRILIPLLGRRYAFGWAFRANLIICSVIAIPTTVFMLTFISILQRTKHFGRTLIVLLITFFIVFIFAYVRQPFTKNHPNIFYAKHTSKSFYNVQKLSNVSFIVPLLSRSSSITVLTHDNLAISPVLNQFSAKSGHILQNKRCPKPTNCTFNDTFNRTIAVHQIQIETAKNLFNYTIIVRHALSYNIRVTSLPFMEFIVRNQLNVSRTETIIDVKLKPTSLLFTIDIRIRRCDVMDSPFLLLFTRLMRNIVLMGKGQCEAIDDDNTVIFDLSTS
jgi:hypothetical protein